MFATINDRLLSAYDNRDVNKNARGAAFYFIIIIPLSSLGETML